MIFFLFYIEIEGKCGRIIGGPKGMLPPPSQIIGGPGPLFPMPMMNKTKTLAETFSHEFKGWVYAILFHKMFRDEISFVHM